MKILNFGFLVILICFNQSVFASYSSLDSVSTTVILKNSLSAKTVDFLYPIIKNNLGLEKLAQALDGLNVNQAFSKNVVENFHAGEDTPGLTVLQLAVLCDRLEMVDYLLKLPDININKVTNLKTVLDYCDFYNIGHILDPELSVRPQIQKKLLEVGACHGSKTSEFLKKNSIFGIKLRKLNV